MAKSSKRPSGDGLLRKRSDGRWEGRIVVGHKKDGSVIYKTEYAKTQKEVLQKLHQNIERYRDIDLSEDCRMTLAEWLDRWLNDYMANSARESTLEGYRLYMETYVNPILGNKQINLITTLDVQKMYAKIRKQGRVKNHPEYGHRLKDSSVRKIHMMLHHAMDTAVQTGLIAKNPTEGTVVPKNNYPPKTVLDDEQLDRFMEEIKKDPIWYDFFYAKTLSGILGHTNASFTLDTYTHVTGDMHRKAAEVVGDLLGNIVGEELAEWGREEKTGTEHCINAVTGNGKAGT